MNALRVVYRNDDLDMEGAAVRFRLTYRGPLRPSQKNAIGEQKNLLAPHKHCIRRQFHRQLKMFWTLHPALSIKRSWPTDWGLNSNDFPPELLDDRGQVAFTEIVRRKHREHGYEWVPLARSEYGVTCGLDILFLRRDGLGSVLEVGDLDNRVKTLIDCLKKPREQNELVGDDWLPREDEKPFFCLLQDDGLVSRLTVESDQLFEPVNANAKGGEKVEDDRLAHIVISVEIRPYIHTLFNSVFL